MASHAAESRSDGLVVERNVECTMRDGITLRGDVYRPARGSYPVLLHRTPYGKDHPMGVTNLMFSPIVAAERDYAVVVQDVRGRFSSEGMWDPIRCERDDGFDAVEWAAAQAWSDGQVGVYGSSYMGVTALQAVAAKPPHLFAAVAYLTGSDYHDGWVYTGGALELLFNLRWAAGQALAEVSRFTLDPDVQGEAVARLRWIAANPQEAMRFTPLEDVFGAADPVVPYWREWLRHPAYDEYWEAIDLTKALDSAVVPVLSIAGWYDGFLKGQLAAWQALGAPEGEPDRGHELIVGPWDHESYQGMRPNAAGDAFFGLEAISGAAGLSATILDWLDRWLKTPSTPARPGGQRVRFFHMGPNEWRTAAEWPPYEETTTLYLRSGGHANSRRGDGRLASEAGPIDTVDTFVHDPRDPVPTCGGRHLGYWYGRAGVQDQSAIELREDILVYTGARLIQPLDVLGSVRARLHVQSSAESTDFTVKLVDVRPDGYCANVAEGITRITPGMGMLTAEEPLEIEVDLWDTAYQFGTGHRIRVEIASSNFPRFDRNGNLPMNPCTTSDSDWATAIQQVFSGPSRPSLVSLGGATSR